MHLPLARTIKAPLFHLTVLCAIILFSCKNPGGRPDASDTHAAIDSTASGREGLVHALMEMRTRLASNDKNQIAKLFVFPEPDSVINHYSLHDSVVFQAWLKDSTFTEKLYDNYYDSISKDLAIPGFGEALTKMDLTKLLHNDHVYDSVEIAAEPCMKEYTIDITSDSVVEIAYGTNNNRHYVEKKKTKKEEDEEIGDECEYKTFWRFVFDGKKLRLLSQNAAG
jgi:hypothetical protein